MQNLRARSFVALLFGASLLVGGCSLFGSDSEGTLELLMTDAPFPFELVEEANVTISRVEIIGDAEGPKPILEETRTYNLLDLRDGVTTLLGEVELPAGPYHQIRLIVEAADVMLADGTVFDLTVPSGSETGIKIVLTDFEIVGGETETLTLDFDVSQSFIVLGSAVTTADIEGFIFTPVVKPIGMAEAEVE